MMAESQDNVTLAEEVDVEEDEGSEGEVPFLHVQSREKQSSTHGPAFRFRDMLDIRHRLEEVVMIPFFFYCTNLRSLRRIQEIVDEQPFHIVMSVVSNDGKHALTCHAGHGEFVGQVRSLLLSLLVFSLSGSLLHIF